MGTRTQEGRQPGNARGRPSMWGPTRREAARRSATVRVPPRTHPSRRIGAWREPSGDRHGGGWDGGSDVAEEAGTGTATGAAGKSPCGGRDRVGMRSLRDKFAVQIGLGLFYGPFM